MSQNSSNWGNPMSKETDNEMQNELRPEYDFSRMKGGIRGKYVERYRSGANLVILDSDEGFPTDDKKVRPLEEVMEEISQKAQKRGLTPEILGSILGEP
jgi:hypothetical protein